LTWLVDPHGSPQALVPAQDTSPNLVTKAVPPVQAFPTWASPGLLVPVFQSTHASQQVLSIHDDFESSPPSLNPLTTPSPPIFICRLSVSFNSLNSCPGLLNSDGSIPYLMLRVVLAGQCSANAVAYLANFGSTLKLEYLKTLAEAYAPGLLASAPPPRTFENSVELASMAAYRLRMPLVIQESDLILAEPGPCDVGLSTLLKLETGNGTTRKFWIAPCLVGGVGLAADRNAGAGRTSTESSKVMWMMAIQVRLALQSPMHLKANGLRLVETKRQAGRARRDKLCQVL